MTDNTNIEYSHEYFVYLQNRSKFRRLVIKLYLRDISRYGKGKSIDFGCGIGELLKILPEGSIGFEINQVSVDYCKSIGLAMDIYNPELDNYNFKMIEVGKYTTFTMNHVLEHLDNSSVCINKILESCNSLGITRIVFTVPGVLGYKTDKTHLTYIDLNYLKTKGLLENKFYKLKTSKYFPINSKLFSKYFTHNELRLVFDKQ